MILYHGLNVIVDTPKLLKQNTVVISDKVNYEL